jgi:hypothetical protein
MKKYVPLLFLVFIASCSLFQKESFEGDWEIKFNGDYEGVFNFTIKEDYSFSFSSNLNYRGGDYNATFKGSIEPDGRLVCNISVNGMSVVSAKGKIDFESGAGTWGGFGLKGNWTAIKK